MTEPAGAEHAHHDCAERWGADHGSLPIGPGLDVAYEGGKRHRCCGVCHEPLDREAWGRAGREQRMALVVVWFGLAAFLAAVVALAWMRIAE